LASGECEQANHRKRPRCGAHEYRPTALRTVLMICVRIFLSASTKLSTLVAFSGVPVRPDEE
jgi:hypothetical protein